MLLTSEARALQRAAFRLAPRKILAYNSRLERHHLRLDLASLLFLRGVPLDRIRLRPWWWPWPKRDRSIVPDTVRRLEGRPCDPARRRVAVLSPYFPYPLSHGGRRAHLPPAPGDRPGVRRLPLRLHRRTRVARSGAGARRLREGGAGGEAAVSRAAVVHAAASRGPRVPVARNAAGDRGRVARVRLRAAAGRVYAAGRVWPAIFWSNTT